jgi:triosephosphate isomerase
MSLLKIPKKSKRTTRSNGPTIVIANWKMNPHDMKEAKKLFTGIKKVSAKIPSNVQAVICPPLIYLADLAKSYCGNKIKFGAQNASIHSNKISESTGEISAEMLKDVGVKYILIGHSERRELGETNEIISKKIEQVLGARLTPVLCVGEKERDYTGDYLRFIEEQLYESLAEVPKSKIKNILIAYEPVWAIGQGHNAMSGHELHQMTIFIKKVLSKIYDKKTAMSVKILYGGSVDEENAKQILEEGEVNGLLVGRASLDYYAFGDLLARLK